MIIRGVDVDYLVKAATEYLEGKSNTWGNLAHAEVGVIIGWLSNETSIYPMRLRESSLSEEVFAILLNPDAVKHYVSLGSAEAIARSVTLRIRSAIRNSQLKGHVVATEIEELDPEVDPSDEPILGGRSGLMVFESALEESELYPASTSMFRPFDDVRLDQWEAKLTISDAQEEEEEEEGEEEEGEEVEEGEASEQSSSNSGNNKLGLIDPNLYKAILEDPRLMRSIDWRSFERLLAQILEDFGYTIDLQRGTKDGGVDIFAIRKGGAFGIEKYLVQAKRWNNAVGVSPVRELAFLHDEYRVTKSCLATTATFTRGAWELADLHKWRLSLKDFDGLREWVQDAQAIRKMRPHTKSSGGIYLPE